MSAHQRPCSLLVYKMLVVVQTLPRGSLGHPASLSFLEKGARPARGSGLTGVRGSVSECRKMRWPGRGMVRAVGLVGRTQGYTRARIRTHARMHARTHARTHACMHARTHARTHTHAHTHGCSNRPKFCFNGRLVEVIFRSLGHFDSGES